MEPPQKRPPVYLIDASVYVFRAWFSIPDTMTTPAGEPSNAAYGFASFLADLLRRTKPDPVAVAFDESLNSSYRNEIYPQYKANRPPAPEDLRRQFAWCRELCRALGLTEAAHPRWEADDLIGTWAAQARRAGHPVVIVTRDKDLAQLVADGDRLWDYAGDKWLDSAGVEAQYGVRPDQIADYLALMGDKVDNIPGVAGVGPKAAAALLQHFDNLEAIFARLDEVPSLALRGARSLREKLQRDAENARRSRQLSRIPTDLEVAPPAWVRSVAESAQIRAYCARMGFGSGLRQRLIEAGG